MLVTGKTSFLRVLVILRKIFIVTNALIGMWLMFKITGWSQGSFLSAFAAIGTTYMETFAYFLNRAFNWIYNLLDSNVVPDIPRGPNPSNLNSNLSPYNGWSVKPMTDNGIMSTADTARSWYSQLINPPQITSDPWYYSWKTWGVILGSVVTIGAIYYGYGYISSWLLAADGSAVNKGKAPQIQV